MAAFLPYPDSLVLLLIHPEVTRMVHSRLCYQIELGRHILERTIPQAMLRQTRSVYCRGTCHHYLRGLAIRR
jgi:hypothetical protein